MATDQPTATDHGLNIKSYDSKKLRRFKPILSTTVGKPLIVGRPILYCNHRSCRMKRRTKSAYKDTGQR
jgi:hypothetical protein